ncbi:hypothetical protein [Nitrosomonas sp.]|uniref:hypothetical protein n=1 Tax=Nitrosomonas sp. TaxID=42353 RepID=UPI00374D5E94
MIWKTKELQDTVLAKYGNKQGMSLTQCLIAIEKRQRFARYHFSEFKRLLEDNINDLILGNDDNDPHAEAHIFALMQCMHGIHDTLAHAIYYALVMDIDSEMQFTDKRNINITNVKGKLLLNNKYKDLVRLITKLVCNDNYKFLNAYVNHSKHRSLINMVRLIDGKKKENMCQLVFSKFNHNHDSFDEKPITEYIELEYHRQAKLVVDIGIEINKVVQQKGYEI